MTTQAVIVLPNSMPSWTQIRSLNRIIMKMFAIEKEVMLLNDAMRTKILRIVEELRLLNEAMNYYASNEEFDARVATLWLSLVRLMERSNKHLFQQVPFWTSAISKMEKILLNMNTSHPLLSFY